MYNMDQFNLLDLNNDVLNIIGDYVKADNDERDFQKYMMKEVKNNTIKLLKIVKKGSWKNKKEKVISEEESEVGTDGEAEEADPSEVNAATEELPVEIPTEEK